MFASKAFSGFREKKVKTDVDYLWITVDNR